MSALDAILDRVPVACPGGVGDVVNALAISLVLEPEPRGYVPW